MSHYGFTVDRHGYTIDPSGNRLARVTAASYVPLEPERVEVDRSTYPICATCPQRCISRRSAYCPSCQRIRAREIAKLRMQKRRAKP